MSTDRLWEPPVLTNVVDDLDQLPQSLKIEEMTLATFGRCRRGPRGEVGRVQIDGSMAAIG